jgi:predicted dehydrogenase
MEHHNREKKLGLALVGLGHYATDCVAVGLENSAHWQLTAIVTGSAEKIPAWQSKWGIRDDRIFSYEDFDRISSCKDVDAVYICLPNSLHAEFTVRAAQAGKHVIVEKPIATSLAEAERMIAACEAAKVKLAIGYRLRFNRLHQQIANLGSTQAKGKVNFINAIFSIDVGPAEQWRLKKSLSGGGALIDVGIYGVQAARYVTGKEPVAVTAQVGPVTDPVKFAEVEEHISWQMRFPDDIYMTGYAGYSGYLDELSIRTANATIKLDPAFSYGPLHGVVRDENEHLLDIPHEHHQWKQMEDLGRLLLDPAPLPEVISGRGGLRDLQILLAIYQAATSGREISL